MKLKMIAPLVAVALTSTASVAATQCENSNELQSWVSSNAKVAITSFVENATNPSSDAFIAKEDRIAVFDNDGTLWSEKPAYFQLAFALDQVKAMADEHPEWKKQEPFNHVLNDDMKSFMAGGHHSILEIVKVTHSGMTVEEFQDTASSWLEAVKDPRFGKAYTELTFKPMKEMLNYLAKNEFKSYIVSGGGVDFMRAWAPEVYGIPEEQIIGSSMAYSYSFEDGKAEVTKLPEVAVINDKTAKVESIVHIIGQKPVLAVGNSDGDYAMMQWATSQPNSMAMIVHHTDAEREWQYDRDSSVGQLDKALDEAATRSDWHVIDMKSDWCTVY